MPPRIGLPPPHTRTPRPSPGRGWPPLAGPWVAASWDPELAEAMRGTGRQIEEELVASELLDALAADASRGGGAV